MKRSALARRTTLGLNSGLERRTALQPGKPLERKAPPRAASAPLSASASRALGSGRGKAQRGGERPRRPRASAASKRAWYDFKRTGLCEHCGARGPREAHHVLLAAYVERIAPTRYFDLANRWLLGIYCGCHPGHHQYGTRDARLPRSRIPAPALAFVRELLGEAAERYLSQRYRDA